jgi:dimethylargininase
VPSVLPHQRHRALVRGIPDTFSDALSGYFGDGQVDLTEARVQHRAYVAALRELGVEVLELDADEAHPDCCFVEDQVVVVDGRALVPTVGHPSRIGEQGPILEALSPHVELVSMEGEARLDGGDVIRVGPRFFVGLSSRTNEAGARYLEDFLRPLGHTLDVVPLSAEALHLGSISSSPGEMLFITPEGWLPMDTLESLDAEGVEVVVVPSEEVYGCNTLAVGPSVLVVDGYPSVARALLDRGYDLLPLQLSEIRAVDGSLTCMSVFY